jgi:hypothetical protein
MWLRAGELPDRKFTPGTANAAIFEEQYRAQCHTRGWTRLYRPPDSFTNSLRRLRMKSIQYPFEIANHYLLTFGYEPNCSRFVSVLCAAVRREWPCAERNELRFKAAVARGKFRTWLAIR